MMIELLHPVSSSLLSVLITGLVVAASLRFPIGLAPYVLWYYGVSAISLACAAVGIPEYSGVLLVLFALTALVFSVGSRSGYAVFRPVLAGHPGPAVLLTVYGLCALLPANDPDSINMHLTFPAQVLARGLHFEATGWFTAQMAGSGEWLSMAGLSLGIDNLQASLQWGALFVFYADIRKLLTGKRAERFFLTGMLSLPVLLFLVPSQKPQLIGSLAVAWSAIFLLQKRETIEPEAGLAGALFAVTIKHSFLITALVPAVFWAARLYRKQRLSGSLRLSRWWPVLLPVPFQLLNLIRWGDPLPPLFTAFFGWENGYLNGYIRSFNNGFFFPLNLFLPKGAGQWSAILGPAVLLYVAAIFSERGRNHRLALAGSLVFAGLLAPAEARFYTEFALVGLFLAADGALGESGLKRISVVFNGMAVIAMLGLCLFGLPRMFHLANNAERAFYHRQFTYDFEAIRWAKAIAAPDSIHLSNLNTRFFLPFETIGGDLLFELKRDPDFLKKRFKKDQTIWVLLKEDSEMETALQQHLALSPVLTADFPRITRNPANVKRDTYRIFAARLKPTP